MRHFSRIHLVHAHATLDPGRQIRKRKPGTRNKPYQRRAEVEKMQACGMYEHRARCRRVAALRLSASPALCVYVIGEVRMHLWVTEKKGGPRKEGGVGGWGGVCVCVFVCVCVNRGCFEMCVATHAPQRDALASIKCMHAPLALHLLHALPNFNPLSSQNPTQYSKSRQHYEATKPSTPLRPFPPICTPKSTVEYQV